MIEPTAPPRLAGDLRLALNSQTPLIRFRDDAVADADDARVDLANMEAGSDYKFTTGGVTRMVFPLLKRWLADGTLASAAWVAMSAGERSPRLTHGGVDLSFVALDKETRRNYANAKEQLWTLLNSNPGQPGNNARATTDEPHAPPVHWRAFDAYQTQSARRLEAASREMGRADLLYVHDFQQMGVARAWRGPTLPKIFHLHTPFPSAVPPAWRDYMLARLHAYDAIVVSTQRYATNLKQAGLRAPIHVVYPFIDPEDYEPISAADTASFRDTYDAARTDRIILNVARMDPMKGQDRLIRAMPRILRDEPDARLVLVGNGSFSSSRKGGLGLSKGAKWRAHLESLAKELGVSDRVTFTGHLADELIPAAYEACDVFCLPSTREGFGLAAIEAWRHEKPIIVCDRAGVSELVHDGENGRVIDCSNHEALAEATLETLLRPEHARAMGQAGRHASRNATLPQGRRALERVFAAVLEARPRQRDHETRTRKEGAVHARA